MSEKAFLKGGEHLFLPNLSVDTILIAYQKGVLKCLLLKVQQKWMLPGGYVGKHESVDEAVLRIVKDRTNLEGPELKFLSVFGDKNRLFPAEFEQMLSRMGMEWDSSFWYNQRFVTLAYFALVYLPDTDVHVQGFDQDYVWAELDNLPEMWMDHKQIAQAARQRLKEDVRHEYLAHRLLGTEFTMPDLHRLHECILEEKLDRSRFQKKMLATGLFERLPTQQNDSPGRNPYRYKVVDAER